MRDLASALPWAGESAARLSRAYPSRALVVEGVDGLGGFDGLANARDVVAYLERHGVIAICEGDRIALSADPARLAGALRALKDDPAQRELFGAISYALARWGEPAHDVPLPDGRTTLALSQRVHVMGIVNVTPDSFSDGGKYLDAGAAIAHGIALAEEGADVLDVGAESTRPGAHAVSAQDEMQRLVPVVEALAGKVAVPVSVDTMKADVAQAALDAGAQIVNDVSAGTHDARMLQLVAERNAPIVLMHMRGEPRTMQTDVQYDDVVGEIAVYLDDRARAALDAGVQRERIMIDPGFGFGKLVEHNLVLLRRLRELRCLGFPVVAGTSRKSFIGKVLDDLPVEERLEGTAATVALAVTEGAAMVRVHDVAAMRRVIRMVEAVSTAVEPGVR